MATKKKKSTQKARKLQIPTTLAQAVALTEAAKAPLVKAGHVQIPLAKVLTLVFNMMEPTADKRVGPELLAEYVGHFTQRDVDDFVMETVRKLPGYSLSDGLRIAERLSEWQRKYFQPDGEHFPTWKSNIEDDE